MTWRLEQLAGPASLCAVASTAVPLLVGLGVAAVSDVDGIDGGVLIAVIFIAVANLTGSVIPMVLGFLTFGATAIASGVEIAGLIGCGAALYACSVLFDLAATTRRRPVIDARVWVRTFAVTATAAAVGAALAFIAWFVATRSTWESIVLPAALVTIGLAVRIGVDVHVRRTGQTGGSL